MEKLFTSLKCALNGIKIVSLEERNFQIHIIAAAFVIILGMAIGVSRADMMCLIVAIVFVLGSEAANTAIEDLCNAVEPNPNPMIGRIKDISAGFVLISSIGAGVIGIMVFLPYFI
jgi:diacylglycerol kinase